MSSSLAAAGIVKQTKSRYLASLFCDSCPSQRAELVIKLTITKPDWSILLSFEISLIELLSLDLCEMIAGLPITEMHATICRSVRSPSALKRLLCNIIVFPGHTPTRRLKMEFHQLAGQHYLL